MKVLSLGILSAFLLVCTPIATDVHAMQTNKSINREFEKNKVPTKIKKGISKYYKGYYKKEIYVTNGVKVKDLKKKQKYSRKMIKGLEKYIKLSEKKKVNPDFIGILEADVKTLKGHVKFLESKIRPLESTRSHVIRAIDDWGDLDVKDPKTFEEYYSETYRLVGMVLSELVRADPSYSETNKSFRKAAGNINRSIQKVNTLDQRELNTLKGDIKDSLEILTARIPPA